MTETKFTPGPWIVKPVEGGEEYWITHDHFDAGPARIVMNKADASLIAAAPEMYVELEQLCNALGAYENTFSFPLPVKRRLGKARVALAKARGELDE